MTTEPYAIKVGYKENRVLFVLDTSMKWSDQKSACFENGQNQPQKTNLIYSVIFSWHRKWSIIIFNVIQSMFTWRHFDKLDCLDCPNPDEGGRTL